MIRNFYQMKEFLKQILCTYVRSTEVEGDNGEEKWDTYEFIWFPRTCKECKHIYTTQEDSFVAQH